MKKLNIKTVVFAGVLVAMNLILARVLAINIGTTLRITLSSTPIFLAGLWLGPLTGGICGGAADLLGCLIQGYAPNPFILVASVLAGVLPGIFKQYVFHDKINTWKIAVIVAVHGLIGSLGFTTVGLHIYYGTPWSVLYTTRTIQTVALVIANTILVSILYQSVLTSFVTQTFAPKRITK
ncbi:MAG: folate family ECF transporter S component [Clostridiales bacterium]|nr:folate family ECF transporter S component [Clostridiales bacterium]